MVQQVWPENIVVLLKDFGKQLIIMLFSITLTIRCGACVGIKKKEDRDQNFTIYKNRCIFRIVIFPPTNPKLSWTGYKHHSLARKPETRSVPNQDVRSLIVNQSESKQQFWSGSHCLARYVYNEMCNRTKSESINSFYPFSDTAVVVTYPEPNDDTYARPTQPCIDTYLLLPFTLAMSTQTCFDAKTYMLPSRI